jgi:hypothetical protein
MKKQDVAVLAAGVALFIGTVALCEKGFRLLLALFSGMTLAGLILHTLQKYTAPAHTPEPLEAQKEA